jgi:hypothetical protein
LLLGLADGFIALPLFFGVSSVSLNSVPFAKVEANATFFLVYEISGCRVISSYVAKMIPLNTLGEA